MGSAAALGTVQVGAVVRCRTRRVAHGKARSNCHLITTVLKQSTDFVVYRDGNG